MVYYCMSKSCRRDFPTPHGLSQHQRKCDMYKRHETDALAKRREAAKAVQIRRAALISRAEATDVQRNEDVMQVHSSFTYNVMSIPYANKIPG